MKHRLFKMDEVVRLIRRGLAGALYVLWRIAAPKGPPGTNLVGDRHIEWSWILAHLPNGGGRALDLGPGPTPLLSVGALQKGFQVLALDIEKLDWRIAAPELTFKRDNLLMETISPDFFDVIICCSMIEHVGIARRYGDQGSVPFGDLDVMRQLRESIKQCGTMLLTLPVGIDALFAPYHRIYGHERLPKLLDGWNIIAERYWVKELDDCWHTVSRDEALARPGSKWHYGLGCFVLTKA